MTWLKNKIVYILVALGILGIAYGATLETKVSETDFLTDIATEQAVKLLEKGKYQHIPLTDATIDGKDVKYTITEYLTPKGEVGYQTIIYYADRVRSINVGPETYRNYEHIYPIIKEGEASTTPQ